MSRRGQPVLYELLGSLSTPEARAARGGGAPHDAGGVGAARQSVRVPIGWFWLSAIAALALMVVAYKFGHASGKRAGFLSGQEWRSDGEAQTRLTGETPDPGRDASQRVDSGGGTARPRESEQVRTQSPKTGTSSSSDLSGVTVPDPRVRGLNYWVVARPGAEDAAKLADFVRSHGLEVAVVPDNNPRFLRVVALPGFEGASESSRSQEARIRSIGKIWKGAARGNRDFDDTYAEKYR